jgi:hypothetical protein
MIIPPDNVATALARAEVCAEKARVTKDFHEREAWLMLERRYIQLARSFELSERLARFTAEADRRNRVHRDG